MLVDGGGKFPYVQEGGSTIVYFIDQTTGDLSALEPLPTGLAFQNGTAAADPSGPYIYSLQNGAIHAFQIVDSSGSLSELQTSPYLIQLGAGTNGLAIRWGISSGKRSRSGTRSAITGFRHHYGWSVQCNENREAGQYWGTTAYRDIFFR
jgi:hypothetical protein